MKPIYYLLIHWMSSQRKNFEKIIIANKKKKKKIPHDNNWKSYNDTLEDIAFNDVEVQDVEVQDVEVQDVVVQDILIKNKVDLKNLPKNNQVNNNIFRPKLKQNSLPRRSHYQTIFERLVLSEEELKKLAEKKLVNAIDILLYFKNIGKLPKDKIFQIDSPDDIEYLISCDPGSKELVFVIHRIQDTSSDRYYVSFKISRKYYQNLMKPSNKIGVKAKNIYSRGREAVIATLQRNLFFARQRAEVNFFRHFKFLVITSLKKMGISQIELNKIRLNNFLISIGSWTPEATLTNPLGNWMAYVLGKIQKLMPNYFTIGEEYTSITPTCCGISHTDCSIVHHNKYFEINGERVYKIFECSKCKKIINRDVQGAKNIWQKSQQYFLFNESIFPTRKQTEQSGESTSSARRLKNL